MGQLLPWEFWTQVGRASGVPQKKWDYALWQPWPREPRLAVLREVGERAEFLPLALWTRAGSFPFLDLFSNLGTEELGPGHLEILVPTPTTQIPSLSVTQLYRCMTLWRCEGRTAEGYRVAARAHVGMGNPAADSGAECLLGQITLSLPHWPQTNTELIFLDPTDLSSIFDPAAFSWRWPQKPFLGGILGWFFFNLIF